MRTRRYLLAGAVLVLPAAAAPAHAQDGFLFGRPSAQITLRAGPVMNRAGGDLFQFFRDELTLERGDFRAPSLGAELAVRLHPRVDFAVGLGWSESESRSEFRDWVDTDDQPIEQTTRFRQVPFTASVRLFPLSRGESIGRLAWVPARTTPYVGGGAGLTWYRLEQHGDFVDESDLSIFTETFESSGNRVTAHALAGVDHWLSSRIGFNLEGRYTVGRARPRDDFADYSEIDLSGLQVTAGISFRW